MNYQSALVQLPLVRDATGQRVCKPEDVSRICSDLQNSAQESFHCLLLNTKNHLLNRVMVSLGIADASLVHPREVFRAAIEANASSIVMVHNHPSGDPAPSSEDLRITRQLVEAGKFIDIKVVDHVIIGRGDPGFISLRESGLCQF
jgi:DNA repair protein RadC